MKNSILFPIALTLLVSACGGGSASFNPPAPPEAQNVVAVSVNGNDFGGLNTPFVTITLCSPTTHTDNPTCMLIDNILVDTGSVGLRIYAQPRTTANLSLLNLTQQTDPVSGNPISQCLPFAQGTTWGPIKYADLRIGGKSAANMALQVISDPQFDDVPAACSNQGTTMESPSDFGANGVLGVGFYTQDCGDNCTTASTPMNIYFDCSTNGQNCVNTDQSLTDQVQNPVALFDTDNNGVILTLEQVPGYGSAFATGTLTFGIDTRDNNASTHTNTILVNNDPQSAGFGFFNTIVNGQNYSRSFFDSGSNGYFFNSPSANPLTPCSTFIGFYCSFNTVFFNASVTGVAGGTSNINFDIADANSLFSNQSHYVFNNVGGDINNNDAIFDWGLPFFFGKSVYVAMENSTTNKGTGPYIGW